MPKKFCETCEQEFATPWSVAKLCPECRVIRDITYMENKHNPKPRACTECSKEFWPIRSTYRQCYECTDWMRAGKRREHTCNICNKHNKVAIGMAETCLGCVMASRQNRKDYVKLLKERFRAREAEL